jgi:hypothetical protein
MRSYLILPHRRLAAMAQTFVTNNEALISVTVSGVSLPAIFSWTTFQGGDVSASTSTLLPGGMQPALALPGPATRADVTVTAPYSLGFDAAVANLENAVGSSTMSASYQTLDADGNKNGNIITRSGYLKEVQIPSWDSKSGEAAMIGLVMQCNT